MHERDKREQYKGKQEIENANQRERGERELKIINKMKVGVCCSKLLLVAV